MSTMICAVIIPGVSSIVPLALVEFRGGGGRLPTYAIRGGGKKNALPMYPGITQVVKLSIYHSIGRTRTWSFFFSGTCLFFDTTLRW